MKNRDLKLLSKLKDKIVAVYEIKTTTEEELNEQILKLTILFDIFSEEAGIDPDVTDAEILSYDNIEDYLDYLDNL